MGFRDLFIQGDNEEDKKPLTTNVVPQKMPESFDKSIPMPTAIISSTVESYQPSKEIDTSEVSAIYQKGFESLNRQGYDFFEFNQSIRSINGNSSDAYKMAFNLGKSMNPQISSESLLKDGEYYIGEIQKAYEKFDSDGQSKKSELENQKSSEKSSLNTQIELKKAQIDKLQSELEMLTSDLNTIDSKYSQELSTVNTKLQANLIAKNNFIGSLQEVLTNIKNWL